MFETSLWPTKDRIEDLGPDAPSKILERQSEFLSQIDIRLKGEVEFVIVPLRSVPLDLLPPMDGLRSVIESSALGSIRDRVVYRFYLGRIDKIYRVEILRFRHSTHQPYPVEIWDCLNNRTYFGISKSHFEMCLKEIFNSGECIDKLRYVLSGSVC